MRYVRVRPDVMALDESFVYAVPEKLELAAQLGSLVRVIMNGRRVNGWIIDADAEPDESRNYKELIAIRSVGPPANVLELTKWASWRWAGSDTAFLDAASPDTMVKVAVTGLDPVTPSRPPIPEAGSKVTGSNPVTEPVIVERAPHESRGDLLLEAAKHNNALLLFPTFDQAKGAQQFLKARGINTLRYPDDWATIRARGGVVVGTRRAAWAPLQKLDAVVVIDAHDHRFVEERAPTWSAVNVVIERARRDGASCVLHSPCATVEMVHDRKVVTSERNIVRNGWPEAIVVDMRAEDPHNGLWSERLVKELRNGEPALCILNRKGRAQLLVCGACNNVAACENCGAHVQEVGEVLLCGRCETSRPKVCQSCGAQRLKRKRIGVSRAKEELEALLDEPVSEISKESDNDFEQSRVIIGTEAALFRLHERVKTIAFVDFDQEILAPVVGATERAMSLVARAARLVPSRHDGGAVLFQTRVPENEVIKATQLGDPGKVREAELARRQILSLPPFAAIALVQGTGAAEFVGQLGKLVDAIGPRDDAYLLRAPTHEALCNALRMVSRPSGRLRIAVDPIWF